MVFDHIEQLKREYTDKYVIVDATQPELRRFEGQTGVVRTVNMNGNALVEFDAYQNIGWYDISLDFLKVIDQPLPKPEPEKAAPKAKAAPKKDDKKTAAPSKGGGMSVAEMLAAARGEKGGEKAAAAPAAKKETPAKPAAGGGKMSVADMLAAARSEKSGGAAGSAPAAEPEPAPAAEEPAVVEEPAAQPTAPAGDLPKDTPGIVAYCRKADG